MVVTISLLKCDRKFTDVAEFRDLCKLHGMKAKMYMHDDIITWRITYDEPCITFSMLQNLQMFIKGKFSCVAHETIIWP